MLGFEAINGVWCFTPARPSLPIPVLKNVDGVHIYAVCIVCLHRKVAGAAQGEELIVTPAEPRRYVKSG